MNKRLFLIYAALVCVLAAGAQGFNKNQDDIRGTSGGQTGTALPASLKKIIGKTVPSGSGSLYSTADWPENELVIRVKTYNIRHGEGMDGKFDLSRIANVLKEESPDYIALQEVDSVTGRSKGRDIARELGDSCGMHAVFARSIPYDGGAYGVAILSKKAPLSVHRIPLPGSEEPRVMLIAEFDHFCLACVHLSLTEKDRFASVRYFKDCVEAIDKPLIIAGDWNDKPRSDFFKAMDKDFVIATSGVGNTYPADVPTEGIDHVAIGVTRRNFNLDSDAVVYSRGLAKVASDHRPVGVNFYLTR